MKRLPRIVLVSFGLLLAAAGGFALPGLAVADRVDVRVDGLVFEPGSAVALELVSAEGGACFGGDLLIEQLELADALGHLITVVAYDTLADAKDWLGVVMLRASDGSDLPPGAYEIRVVTSGGTFAAGISVVPAGQFASLERFVAGVPACNVALRAYRLISELDDGARVTLRQGDRLMVLLAGNPTTGYSWSNALVYEYASLRESEEVEYRSNSALMGAGGYFLFRYWAVDVGDQAFRFEYERPWESVDPIMTVSLSVDVR